ncbi:MAG: DUF6795 domain-containing protein [Cellvibrio sp.]
MSFKKITLILLLSISVFSTGGFAMGFFDAGKVCLFSGISGVITKDGKPVASARVVRTADRDGERKDETTTDENGYFELPPIFERTVTKLLPMEFVASQSIFVTDDGVEYDIWYSVKRDPAENTEARGKPLKVTCELNSETVGILVEGVGILSKCTWDVEPDAPKIRM